jgi:ABC-type Fe3+ transport system substrate-binding protein
VITCYPADDDGTLYLFYLIVQKYGWAWMDKYMATKPNFDQGHLPVARSVASGENIATSDASSSDWPFKREGKLEIVWSAVDGAPVFTPTGGIFNDAPHRRATRTSRGGLLLPGREASTCRLLKASSHSRLTRSPTTIASS